MKKPFVQIESMQQRSIHIQKNKLSDKFNRRDIQFYDLYVKNDNGEELAKLRDNQYPLNIDAEQYYQELEVDDFNKLFANECFIDETFGSSIKIEVSFNGNLIRKVKEYPELVQTNERQHQKYEK